MEKEGLIFEKLNDAMALLAEVYGLLLTKPSKSYPPLRIVYDSDACASFAHANSELKKMTMGIWGRRSIRKCRFWRQFRI